MRCDTQHWAAMSLLDMPWLTSSATCRSIGVSFARGAAKEWSSVHVARGQAGSRHRQIRLNHRTRTARAKQGASCGTWTTATVTDRHHTAVRAPGQRLVGLSSA